MSAKLTPLNLSVDESGKLIYVVPGNQNFDAAVQSVLRARGAVDRTIQFTFRDVTLDVWLADTAETIDLRYREGLDANRQKRKEEFNQLRLSVNERSANISKVTIAEYLVWLADYMTLVNENGYTGFLLSNTDVLRDLMLRGFNSNMHAGTFSLEPNVRTQFEYVLGQIMVRLQEKRTVGTTLIEHLRGLIPLLPLDGDNASGEAA